MKFYHRIIVETVTKDANGGYIDTVMLKTITHTTEHFIPKLHDAIDNILIGVGYTNVEA